MNRRLRSRLNRYFRLVPLRRPAASGHRDPRRLPGALLAVVLLLAGCVSESTKRDPEPPPPFADCAMLLDPPSDRATDAAGPAPGAGGSASGAAEVGAAADVPATLPEVELPCFTGGSPFALTALSGPAVINLWASWCAPCRKELPAFQRLAERHSSDVHVLGVIANDDRAAAQSLAVDLGLTFPNLYDRDGKLGRALARPHLPMTLFVDATGRLRHVDQSGALDDAELATLVHRHLDVVVTQ